MESVRDNHLCADCQRADTSGFRRRGRFNTCHGTRYNAVGEFPSPDGKHFLFNTYLSTVGDQYSGEIEIAALDEPGSKNLLNVASNAQWARGQLLYVFQQNLMARPFDLKALDFEGDARPIAEKLVNDPSKNHASCSASQHGVLVYQSGATRPPALFLVNRSGAIVSALTAGSTPYVARFSPDQKRIVLGSEDVTGKNSDLWMYEIGREINTRLTFDPGYEIAPVFSPDGNRIVFTSNRPKPADLFVKDLTGMGSEQLLYHSRQDKYAIDWSPDGSSLLVSARDNQGAKWDMILLPLTGDTTPVPLATSEFNEFGGMVSPDGRWVAYQSDESGKNEIYVRSIDPKAGKFQVSNGGGTGMKWTRGSNEIIYSSPDRKAMCATVHYTATSFEVVHTSLLFDQNINGLGDLKDVSADGKTFLVQLTGMEGASLPATLVVNWDEELNKK